MSKGSKGDVLNGHEGAIVHVFVNVKALILGIYIVEMGSLA